MSELNLKDATLHYETIGSGPLFVFVPGANGTGDIFAEAAKHLQDNFTVVMFDRRDYGESKRIKPLSTTAQTPHSIERVQQDADDVAALVKALSSDGTAYILGSSSGSIVVMETLQDHPEVFKKALFHESPINVFLPADQKQQAQADNQAIVDLANAGDIQAAMQLFAKNMNIGPLDTKMMSRQPQNVDQTVTQRAQKVRLFWMNYEIRQYTSREINIDIFHNFADNIVFLNGTDSVNSFPYNIMKNLSAQTQIQITDIPGGHLGYAQKPAGYAQVLKDTLN